MEVRLRPVTTSEADVRFLRAMLCEAACWRGNVPGRTVEEVMADPKLALYVQSWGRTGDAGVVAEDQTGRPLGAAWYRLFTSDEHGYGFVDVAIPELTVAVKAEVRDRGVGTALLQGLVERARVDGVPALSLSVEEDNPALSLYEWLGFVVVGRIEDAWTMRRDLD